MNYFYSLFSILSVAAVIGGCTQSNKGADSRPTDSTLAKSPAVIEEIHDQRATYLKKVEADIKEWQRKVDDLRVARDKNPIHSERYVQLNRKLEKMGPELSLASQELESLKSAVASAWQQHQPTLDRTVSALKETDNSVKAE